MTSDSHNSHLPIKNPRVGYTSFFGITCLPDLHYPDFAQKGTKPRGSCAREFPRITDHALELTPRYSHKHRHHYCILPNRLDMAHITWYQDFDTDEEREAKDIIKAGIENDGDTRARIEQAAVSLDTIALRLQQADGIDKAENFRWRLQDAILHIASLVPYDSYAQDNLVLLLFALRQLPDQPGSSHYPGWKLLFSDTVQITENWYGADDIGSDLQNTGDEAAEHLQQMRYRNFNSFCARMSAQEFVDMSLCGFWCLRTALEEPEHDEKSRSDQDLAPRGLMIDIALDWIFIDGKRLFDYDERHPREDEALQAGPGLDLASKGPRTRWDDWAQRLKDASADETLDHRTRLRAAEGAQLILNR